MVLKTKANVTGLATQRPTKQDSSPSASVSSRRRRFKLVPVRVQSLQQEQEGRLRAEIEAASQQLASEYERNVHLKAQKQRREDMRITQINLRLTVAATSSEVCQLEQTLEEVVADHDVQLYSLEQQLKAWQSFSACPCDKDRTIAEICSRQRLSWYCRCCELLLAAIQPILKERSGLGRPPGPRKLLDKVDKGPACAIRTFNASEAAAQTTPPESATGSEVECAKTKLFQHETPSNGIAPEPRVSLFSNRRSCLKERQSSCSAPRKRKGGRDREYRSSPSLASSRSVPKFKTPGRRASSAVFDSRIAPMNELMSLSGPSLNDFRRFRLRSVSKEFCHRPASFENPHRDSHVTKQNSCLSKLILNSNKSHYSRSTKHFDKMPTPSEGSLNQSEAQTNPKHPSPRKNPLPYEVTLDASQENLFFGNTDQRRSNRLSSLRIDSIEIPNFIETFEKL